MMQGSAQSMSHSFSLNQDGNSPDRQKFPFHPRQDTLDSNGNIIRGRRIDSPQLVVVRELRDQEDLEEGATFSGSGGEVDVFGFNSGLDAQEMTRIWKSKERTQSESKRRS